MLLPSVFLGTPYCARVLLGALLNDGRNFTEEQGRELERAVGDQDLYRALDGWDGTLVIMLDPTGKYLCINPDESCLSFEVYRDLKQLRWAREDIDAMMSWTEWR